MDAVTQHIPAALIDYIRCYSVSESDLLRELREKTRQLTHFRCSPPEQGQLLAWLIKLMNAKKVLEVGTLTGYSALWMAQALPLDGKLVACDISRKFTNIAQHYWRQAQVNERIELRLGRAVETLSAMCEIEKGTFDFIYIDADKANYDTYYESSLSLLRSGSLLVMDNMLWHGKVLEENHDDISTIVIHNLNEKISQDARVDCTLLPIGDGVTLVRKI